MILNIMMLSALSYKKKILIIDKLSAAEKLRWISILTSYASYI